MLKLAKDEKMIKDFSSNCIDQVKKFDIELIGDKWKKILD